jgi:L-amino acid N-acyltransferase YncA
MCKFESKGIYHATKADIPEMLEVAKLFYEASGYGEVVEYDPGSLEATLGALVPHEDAIILVIKKDGKVVGGAGAMVFPFYFNFYHKTGTELFYWINEEDRGVGLYLLKALEHYAKEKGARSFSMISLEKLNPEGVGTLYNRLGYKLREHSYVKGLE